MSTRTFVLCSRFVVLIAMLNWFETTASAKSIAPCLEGLPNMRGPTEEALRSPEQDRPTVTIDLPYFMNRSIIMNISLEPTFKIEGAEIYLVSTKQPINVVLAEGFVDGRQNPVTINGENFLIAFKRFDDRQRFCLRQPTLLPKGRAEIKGDSLFTVVVSPQQLVQILQSEME